MAERNIKQRAFIVDLIDNGSVTYSVIAKEIGISRSRVRQIYIDEKARDIKSLDWTGNLSGRAIGIIHKMELNSKEEVLSALKLGRVREVRRCGLKTYQEICRFVGFDKMEVADNDGQN